MILFIWNSKYKLTYNDRYSVKSIHYLLENEGAFREKGIIKGHENTFEGDRHIYYINYGND